MTLGISGTHGVGKTTLIEDLCERLEDHHAAREPFYLLEEEGYQFEFPPSLADYRAMLRCSLMLLDDARPNLIFDRTPLDFLAYMAALGGDIRLDVDASLVRAAFAGLDLLVIVPITRETEQVLPAADMPRLRKAMNAALFDLLYDDPLDAWRGVPVLELACPLRQRAATVLTHPAVATRSTRSRIRRS